MNTIYTMNAEEFTKKMIYWTVLLCLVGVMVILPWILGADLVKNAKMSSLLVALFMLGSLSVVFVLLLIKLQSSIAARNHQAHEIVWHAAVEGHSTQLRTLFELEKSGHPICFILSKSVCKVVHKAYMEFLIQERKEIAEGVAKMVFPRMTMVYNDPLVALNEIESLPFWKKHIAYNEKKREGGGQSDGEGLRVQVSTK